MTSAAASGQFIDPPGAAPAFLRAELLTKSYGAVRALSPTDFAIHPGEVVGLIGHNGAGKSTLINLLAGTVEPSGGALVVDGVPLQRWSALLAQRAGLRCVFQELSLCPNLTAVENTRVLHRSLSGFGWKARAKRVISAALDRIFPGHGILLDVPVGELSIGQRQMIEIARAFTETDRPVRAIILDEPTSSLGPEATGQLLTYIKIAARGGIAVILITHRLNEILAVAGRVVVMKDGAIIAEAARDGLTRSALVAAMGTIEAMPRQPSVSGPARQDAPIIRDTGAGQGDLPVELRAGEIVGFAGLDGHGQRERLRAIHDRAAAGSVSVAFVAGDRVVEGVFALWSIRDNLIIRSLKALSRRGIVNRRAGDGLAQRWFDRLQVRAPDIATPLVSLSGGNQQKVLFARALASNAQVIVLDDPMRGVDVGTKQEVYALIKAEASAGRAFIWYSTEIEELENCDRVHVFREGRAVVTLEGQDIDHNRIIAASFGSAPLSGGPSSGGKHG